MLAKRIIPCLDIKNGMTVKGVAFENIQMAGNPIEMAKEYAAQGAYELVFLDITASKDKHTLLKPLIKEIAQSINIPFTIGGGINKQEDAEELLNVGADKISINTAAVLQPDLVSNISKSFGNQFVVVAIDAKFNGISWEVFIKGGTEKTDKELFSWALELQERGAGEILFTSINHDGTKNGFANEALCKLSENLSIPIIASGGAGSMHHFFDALTIGKADAVLAASVFHYKEIEIPSLKNYLKNKKIPIRV